MFVTLRVLLSICLCVFQHAAQRIVDQAYIGSGRAEPLFCARSSARGHRTGRTATVVEPRYARGRGMIVHGELPAQGVERVGEQAAVLVGDK